MKIFTFFWYVILFSIAPGIPEALARYATPEEVTQEIQLQEVETRIRRDGTGRTKLHLTYRIVRGDDLGKQSTVQLPFNSRFQKLKKFRASVTNGKRVTVVPAKNIEVKPLATPGAMLQPLTLVKFVLPSLQQNSVVELNVEFDMLQSPTPGAAFDFVDFENDDYVVKYRGKYISEIPLDLEYSDPDSKFKFEKTKVGNKFVVTYESIAPLTNKIVEESNLAPRPPRHWLSVTSIADWTDLAKFFEKNYERTIAAPLPPVYEEILSLARKEATLLLQVKRAMAELGERIYYVQDYDTALSSLFPRELKAIAESRYGDCKDFAASTVVLLRNLGVTAYVATIHSAMRETKPRLTKASPDRFNHAIVYAIIDGKEYWLDPTLRIGYTEDIHGQNADRPALVVSSKVKDPYRTTPKTDPQKQTLHYQKDIFRENARGERDFKIAAEGAGEYGLRWTGLGIGRSLASIEHLLLDDLDNAATITQAVFTPFDLSSRMYRDVKLEVRGSQRVGFLKTSAGEAYYRAAAPIYTSIVEQLAGFRVGDLDLGRIPGSTHHEYRFHNARLVGKAKTCRVDSPWFEFERKYENAGDGILFSQRETIRQRFIPVETINSSEFARTKTEVAECAGNTAILFE